ncbi:MAG: DUF4440 domain-containing protein [Candidatus Solibacter sp.]
MGRGCCCCSQQPVRRPPPRDTHDADIRSIAEAEVLWVRHWKLRDAERIISHYSEDATMSLPNAPPAVGREAIKEAVKEIVRDGDLAFTFEAQRVEVAKSGDYGYAEGAYTLTMIDAVSKKAAADHGTFLPVYRKQLNGGWRVLQDMRSSRLPNVPVIED